MIPYEEALALVEAEAGRRGPLAAETVPLSAALGRVSARALASRESLPAFDNSAMDGFAVSSAATRGASPASPLRLSVTGLAAAGDAPRRAAPRTCWEINTGAPLPRGLDAVVRREDLAIEAGGRAVVLEAPAEPGDWVRRRGTDFRAGMPVLAAGSRVDARSLVALGALGFSRLSVRKRPVVALIGTGSELAAAGARPGPGRIRDSTGLFLETFLRQAGCETVSLGTVPDEPRLFERALSSAGARGADAVVSTGAVSKGRRDFVPGSLARLGAELVYHGVAIRPGKPGLLASLPDGRAVFGLPGNPVSTVVGARFFLWPFLRRLLGEPPERPLAAALAEPADKPAGLLCFFKAKAALGPRGLRASVLEGQASFQLKSLLEADSWAVLPAGPARLAAGSRVALYPLLPRGLPEALPS